MKKWMIRLVVVMVLIIGAVGWGYRWYSQNSTVQPGEIDILPGASARQVADLMEANGILANADAFYYYLRLKESYYQYIAKEPYKFQVNFKQGTFSVKAKTFDQVIAQLNKGVTKKPQSKTADNTNGMVTIPEGVTVEQIATILEKNQIIDAESFLSYIENQQTYENLRKKYIWLPPYEPQKHYQLEGFLHANTYDLSNGMLPNELVDKFMSQTDQWYEKNKVTITSLGLSFDQLVTLASIVERESKFEEDRPKVAQVFYNRMLKGMKLESDITAAYGNGEHKVFMYHKDIQKESPYNTYLVPSLPVGPIASPSESSFQAVLHAAGPSFDALYFYARPSGETFYASTFEEHEKNRLKYEHEWKALEKK